MNLPAAIDALEQPIGLPPGLLLKSEEIRNDGGGSSLVAMFEHLCQIAKQSTIVINEGLKVLEEEENEDKELRQQFGKKWDRKDSETCTNGLKKEAEKNLSMLKEASKSDTVIQGKIEKNLPAIEQLSGSPQDLQNAIPASNPSSSKTVTASNPHISTLKEHIAQGNTLKGQAAKLIQQLKSHAQKDDIVPRLLDMYGTRDITDPSEAFRIQLSEYNSFVTQIDELIAQFDPLLQSIHVIHYFYFLFSFRTKKKKNK